MFRPAILSLGLAVFGLSLVGCGGSQKPGATPPADQEKARGGPRTQPPETVGTNK